MDNYWTHNVAKVRSWRARHPRHHVHFTPTSGRRLNLVERLLTEMTERCVRRGSHTGIRSLKKASEMRILSLTYLETTTRRRWQKRDGSSRRLVCLLA